MTEQDRSLQKEVAGYRFPVAMRAGQAARRVAPLEIATDEGAALGAARRSN